ncbi:SDR family NAD(P)-dependent oxidoreductase [Pseudonocardia sp. DSM 110487]|nr:SDR family NAD(P)-dependent oxidoreductase [Pseudonocardia sp. DSM 110487]
MTAPARTTARDLDGKVAIVVGGSRNMGAEFAVGLAARGATTVISYAGDVDVAAKTLARLEEHGVSAEAVRTDATDAAQIPSTPRSSTAPSRRSPRRWPPGSSRRTGSGRRRTSPRWSASSWVRRRAG